MTKELIKNRYEFTSDGNAIIDISVESISALFNSFDKKATFTKRELDQDFADYVVDCVKELGNQGFIIRVTIDKEYNMLQESILRKAVTNHFNFLYQIERRKLHMEAWKCFIFSIVGMSLMTAISFYTLPDTANVELWKKVAYEGVTIASWVALWEATTAVIFGWHPFYAISHLYSRILKTQLIVLNNVRRIEL